MLCCFFFLSCAEQKQQKESFYLIDKEKIDRDLSKDFPNVLLDHLYIVVDSISYQKITSDKNWKNTYASLDVGLPSFAPVADQSTTCYLRGRQHYIEILCPDNTCNESIRKNDISFFLEATKNHFQWSAIPVLEIENDSFLYASKTVKMIIDDHQNVLFKAFYTLGSETFLHTWYGSYKAVFLDNLHGKHHPFYSHEACLQTTYENQKLFHGIKEIYLRCTTDDYIGITQELRYLKFALLENKNNALTIVGGDTTIHLELSSTVVYSRITKIICQLNTEDISNKTLENRIITNQGTESIRDLSKLHKKEHL